MFCEGDKTYPENTGCPVCGMDLVKITGKDDDAEDDTYKNLRKMFWLSNGKEPGELSTKKGTG